MKNLSIAFSALLILAACCKKEDESIPVESVSLLPTASIVVNGTYELKAVISPINAADKSLTWSSDKSGLVTVDQNGVVTGKAAGKAVITVTSKSHPDKSAKCEVQVVTKKAVSITITPENPKVMEGKTLELKATVLPAEAAQSVIWSSGDKSKATVDPATGIVTGVEAGETTIIATTADGSEVKGEVRITVQSEIAASITEIKLGAEKIVVSVPKPGETTTLSYAPRTIAANLAEVPMNITATEGAIIKIGEARYTKDQKVDFTRSVTFSVTEEGKVGSKKYTLTIMPYNKESNPYGIYNVAHLHDMRNALSEGFKLMDDLTLPAVSTGFKEISDYGTGGWLPIGNDTNPFTGSLDGAGHKIIDFYTDRSLLYVGLFGKLGSEASIKDLGVIGITGTTGTNAVKGDNASTDANQYTGILAGYSEGTIENCYTSGNVFASSSSIQNGLVAAGGLAGYVKGKISNCHTTGNVSVVSSLNAPDTFAGGLAGLSENATITGCSTTGNVHSGVTSKASSFAGGLVGNCKEGTTTTATTLSKCYATGDITATSGADASGTKGAYAGGLTGQLGAHNSVNNSYALGNVSATTSNKNAYAIAGGLVGYGSRRYSISNSYAVGNVSCSNNDDTRAKAGGLLGNTSYTNSNATTNSYRNSGATIKKGDNAVEPTDKNLSGLTAKPLADMKAETFKGKLNEGQSTTVWGYSTGKNGDLPYIIGVGVGK